MKADTKPHFCFGLLIKAGFYINRKRSITAEMASDKAWRFDLRSDVRDLPKPLGMNNAALTEMVRDTRWIEVFVV